VIGRFAASGISNLYYPPSERGSVSLMFANFGIAKAMSAAQNVAQEFFVRRLTPRVKPTAP